MSISSGAGTQPDRRVARLPLAVAAAEHPGQDARVLAEAGPQEAALGVLAEPVDVEDLRQDRAVAAADGEPVARSSRPCCSRRTAASPSGRSAARRPRRPGRRSSPSDIVAPMNTPCSQSKASRTSGTTVARRPPKRNASIGHAGGVLPLGRDRRALGGRGGEARVRVRGGLLGAGRPVLAVPVDQVRRAARSVIPSHHTSPSSVRAQLVKIEFARTWRSRSGSCRAPVPGATPKKPASGLTA